MGFMYNPARTTAHYLYAGVLKQFPGATDDETTTTVTVTGGPYGPNVAIYNPHSALEYIKVAFVLSRFDSSLAAPVALPAAATYPMGSANMQYSSSYIYTPVSTFN